MGSYYTCKHGTNKRPCCASCREEYKRLESKRRVKRIAWRVEASRIWHKKHSGIENLNTFKKFIENYVAEKEKVSDL